MKKAKILFHAFAEASYDAHVASMLYSQEVWGKDPSTRRGPAVHSAKWEECPVDACKMRYQLAVYMAKKV